MIDHDIRQLRRACDSMRRAPMAREVEIGVACYDRACGPSERFSTVDNEIMTDDVNITPFVTVTTVALQTAPQSNYDVATSTDSVARVDGSSSARCVSTPLTNHFNEALRHQRRPQWTWGDRPVTHSAATFVEMDGEYLTNAEANELTAEAVAQTCLASCVAEEICVRNALEAHCEAICEMWEALENTARSGVVSHEQFLCSQRDLSEVEAREAIVSESLAAATTELAVIRRHNAAQAAEQCGQPQLVDVSTSVSHGSQMTATSTDATSPGFLATDETSDSSVDHRVYRRMIEDLEARERELKDELNLERARALQGLSQRNPLRTVGLQVAAARTDARCGGDVPLATSPRVHLANSSLVVVPTASTTFQSLSSDACLQTDSKTFEDAFCEPFDAVVTKDIAVCTAPAAECFDACAGTEFIPPPVLEECGVQVLPDYRHADCSTAAAQPCEASCQVGTYEQPKYATLPPSGGGVLMEDEEVQTAPSTADAQVECGCDLHYASRNDASTSAGAPPAVQLERFTQTFTDRQHVGCSATAATFDFGQTWGKRPAVLADAASTARVLGTDVKIQCSYHVGQRTRATYTGEDAVLPVRTRSMGVGTEERGDLFVEGSMVVSAVKDDEAVAEVMSRLAASYSVFGRKGRTMSAMFEDVRRRLLEQEHEGQDGNDDEIISPLLAAGEGLDVVPAMTLDNQADPRDDVRDDLSVASVPDDDHRTLAGHAASGEGGVSASVQASNSTSQAVHQAFDSHGVQVSTVTLSRGCSPMRDLLPSREHTPRATGPTRAAATRHAECQTEGTDADDGRVPWNEAFDSVTAAVTAQQSDLMRDVRSAFSHTRATTASSAHLFGLTGTRPNSVAPGQFDGSLNAATAAAELEMFRGLREAAVIADSAEPHQGGMSSVGQEATTGATASPAVNPGVDRLALARFDWRGSGRATAVAFGSHITNTPPARRTDDEDGIPDLRLAVTPSPSRLSVAEVLALRSAPPSKSVPRARSELAKPARPKQMLVEDPSLLSPTWTSHTPSRYSDDACLPKRVPASTTVKHNGLAFDEAARSPGLQRSSTHVVKALGVALPRKQGGRPHRLVPLGLPECGSPTYAPTLDGEPGSGPSSPASPAYTV
jgi:hypothetical protein